MKRLVKQELMFWVDILPDDISTRHMETRPAMRMHGRMRMRICSRSLYKYYIMNQMEFPLHI